MMGRQDRDQRQLFYEFSLDEMIPKDHLLRRINVFARAVLADLHEQLKTFYSDIGRLSVDPELMIRMLLVGYCYSIRHERRLCQEVGLHLAYRWFCKLDLDRRFHTIRPSRQACFRRSIGGLHRQATDRLIEVRPKLEVVIANYSFSLSGPDPSRVMRDRDSRTRRSGAGFEGYCVVLKIGFHLGSLPGLLRPEAEQGLAGVAHIIHAGDIGRADVSSNSVGSRLSLR